MVAGVRLKDRYLVERFPLGRGGMGEVWPAQDTVLDRPVIVKLISESMMDAGAARRFRREARLTARLVHPGVPAIHDFGQHEGRFYLVMQRIVGVALDDLIGENSPLPVPWVAAIGAQIAAVLSAAAKNGLIHRDIKPGNVMLEPSGAVKVLDFGLASIPGDERYSRITETGASLGTAGYMAPEQIEGGRTDHRTDLYGLGATLFHLLTGRPPFDDEISRTGTMLLQLQSSPPRPGTLRPEVPDALDELVHALLARRPADRPGSASAAYAVLAPLARDLPPLPGAVSDEPDPVREYAAVVGQVPVPARRAAPSGVPEDTDPQRAVRQAEERAESLASSGNPRAAARLWRQLADARAAEHGEDDPEVVAYHLRVIRVHAALGEHSRALRQLHDLRNRISNDHPAAPAIEREIAQLGEKGPDRPAS